MAGKGSSQILLQRMRTPAYRPVVRRVSLERASFAFAPLRRLQHQRDSRALAPEPSTACQIFGAFFRSKFRHHSVRRTGLACGFGPADFMTVASGR